MPDKSIRQRLRDWLTFWCENVKRSYEIATEHSNIVSFVAPLFGTVAGVIGISSLTANTYLVAIGGTGAGLILWFAVLMLFVTPAQLWSENRHTVASGLSPTQKAAIRDVLRKYPRPADDHGDYRYFVIFPIPGIGEASVIAAQLRAVFGECGLDTQLISNELPGLRDTSPFNHGVWLRGRGDMDQSYYQPPTLAVLREALERAAIPFRYTPDDVGDVELIIGAPPSTPSDAVVAELSTTAYNDDVRALKREIVALRAFGQRHLSPEQQATIAQVARRGLDDLWKSIKASPSWTGGEEETLIFIQLYTIETERETSIYCADFEKAFQSGGLGVALGELTGTQGYRDNERYVGAVSMLRGNQKNVVGPFILEALSAAGIDVNECDDLPQSMMRRNYGPGGESLGATLIIGQRG